MSNRWKAWPARTAFRCRMPLNGSIPAWPRLPRFFLQKKELRLGGLYTSGGEVTVAVARRLRASGFSVRGEVLPLAVYGRLIGGEYPDFPMVTKGGFVGDSESIVQCVNYLFTKISTQTRLPEDEE